MTRILRALHEGAGLSVKAEKVQLTTVPPRGRGATSLAYGIDEGVPFHGRRYGGASTIHNTGTVDVVLKDGVVTEVWFRCQPLAFSVSDPKGTPAYGSSEGARLVAVEVAE